ncbi:MAG: hypothetical protein ACJ8D0_10375, partial [Xanthobacteraceae bacterium]
MKNLYLAGGAAALALLVGCSHVPLPPMPPAPTVPAVPAVRTMEIPNVAPMTSQPQSFCQNLAGMLISPAEIDLPSGRAVIESAVLLGASDIAVAERAATPAGAITPAMPQRCKVLGRIAPRDPDAPPINF